MYIAHCKVLNANPKNYCVCNCLCICCFINVTPHTPYIDQNKIQISIGAYFKMLTMIFTQMCRVVKVYNTNNPFFYC